MISKLVPAMQPRVMRFLNEAKAAGFNLRIVSGYRSTDEQNRLYAQGRTQPGKIVTNLKGGQSLHNYGRAIDVVDREKGYDIDWERLGEIGERCGLVWGGRWERFIDKPHFEYNGPAEDTPEEEEKPMFRTHATEEDWFRETYGFMVGGIKPGGPTPADLNHAYHVIRKEKYDGIPVEQCIINIMHEQFANELAQRGPQKRYVPVTKQLFEEA